MWHKMLDGWQCIEGFGKRMAIPEGGDPAEGIGFETDGSLKVCLSASSAARVVVIPETVLGWLRAPLGSEPVLPEDGALPIVVGTLKDGTPVYYGREP